jgi:hypothetical protein
MKGIIKDILSIVIIVGILGFLAVIGALFQ